MRSAGYDKRITIQSRTVSQDATYGSQTVSWADLYADVPAQVQDVLPSKSEEVKSNLQIANLPSRVRIRYIPGIDSSMRVIVHGEVERTCEIMTPPAEIGRREALELMIREFSSN